MKKIKRAEIRKALQAASALYSNKSADQAASLYQQILAVKPDCYEALNNLGLIMQSIGNIANAETMFRHAMRSNPNAPEAYNNLGNVANSCGRPDKALELYSKASTIKPDYYEAIFNRGTVHHQANEMSAAISDYKKALSINPDYQEACCNLGIALKQTGASAEALKYFERALLIDPENSLAKHLTASLQGDNANTVPKEYVKGLFDGFASDFENILVDGLEYSIPSELRKMMEPYLKNLDGAIDILDVGCGTGLIGECFRDVKHLLVGVDISENMISEAKKKNIYDSLCAADVVEFMRQDIRGYHVVIAADVFVYIGDLADIFASAKKIMVPKAYFVFSIEGLEDEGKDYLLRPTGRFAHSETYIKNLSIKYDLKVMYRSSVNIRKENNRWISGYCFILKN